MPDFITRWIRNTSVTQRMRSSLIPNKRIQDTSKVPLLCTKCEGVFGKFETYFSESIFKPVIDSYTPLLNYDARLLKFGVSLVWRYLAVSLPQLLRLHPTQKGAIEVAEQKWRGFLFDDLNLNGYEIHLLMLKRVIGAPTIKGTDLDINWYFFRTVGGTVCLSFKDPFVLIKLPAFIFIAPLKPVPFTHMTGTRIYKEGVLEFNNQVPSDKILKLFLDYAEEALYPLGTISNRQKDKIKADYEKNKNKVTDSYGFKVFLANEEDRKNKRECGFAELGVRSAAPIADEIHK